MSPESIFLVAVIVVVLAVIGWRYRPLPKFTGLPYRSRRRLLSQGELAFYRVLLRAIPTGTCIFMKVRVADAVSTPDCHWQKYGRPVAGLHLDFVLADAETSEIRCCVELDDKSHGWRDQQERDAFKSAVLEAAGIPLLRVKAAASYDANVLRKSVAEKLRD